MSAEVETDRERESREYDERMERRTAHHSTDRLPVQMNHPGADRFWRAMLHGTRRRGTTVPRIVAEAAWEGYDADGHGEQSCQRLHERGGFDLGELGYYLARAVDEGRVRIELCNTPPERAVRRATSDL